MDQNVGFDYHSLSWLFENLFVSEITPEGRRITKLDQILLNGNNITMLVPGGEGPEVWITFLDICLGSVFFYNDNKIEFFF